MKITIEVHHVISLAPELTELLKDIFPDSGRIADLTNKIKTDTAKVKAAVDQNTPQ